MPRALRLGHWDGARVGSPNRCPTLRPVQLHFNEVQSPRARRPREKTHQEPIDTTNSFRDDNLVIFDSRARSPGVRPVRRWRWRAPTVNRRSRSRSRRAGMRRTHPQLKSRPSRPGGAAWVVERVSIPARREEFLPRAFVRFHTLPPWVAPTIQSLDGERAAAASSMGAHPRRATVASSVRLRPADLAR